ncbi:hypothetical protein TNCV_2217211 [Trichonephila clavipes]|nr:hypothetical protein TNCV_2217211 [Trichonephila clavipes]
MFSSDKCQGKILPPEDQLSGGHGTLLTEDRRFQCEQLWHFRCSSRERMGYHLMAIPASSSTIINRPCTDYNYCDSFQILTSETSRTKYMRFCKYVQGVIHALGSLESCGGGGVRYATAVYIYTLQDALFTCYKQSPDNACSVAFSQLSNTQCLIEDETLNDYGIIHNLTDSVVFGVAEFLAGTTFVHLRSLLDEVETSEKEIAQTSEEPNELMDINQDCENRFEESDKRETLSRKEDFKCYLKNFVKII